MSKMKEDSALSLYRPDLIGKVLQVSKTAGIAYLLHRPQDLIQWAFI
jgi:hypothetical protein